MKRSSERLAMWPSPARPGQGEGGRDCSASAGWKGHSSNVTLNIMLVCCTLDLRNTFMVWLHWKNNHVYTVTQ